MLFAIPFTAPPHDTLAGRVFGRFMPQSPAPAGAGPAGVPLAGAGTSDDGVPDLAQRVRETGEW